MEKVSVRATRPEYRALAHPVDGPLDPKTGKGEWTADGFTFRLLEEKSIRRALSDEADEDGDGLVTSTAAAEGKRVQDAVVPAPKKG